MEIVKKIKKNNSFTKKNPATKTLQAIRIFVNNEVSELIKGLIEATKLLNPGAILIVVSFHSLEDRRVKKAFLGDERLERITKKPLPALPSEIKQNHRSRSAKYMMARRKL